MLGRVYVIVALAVSLALIVVVLSTSYNGYYLAGPSTLEQVGNVSKTTTTFTIAPGLVVTEVREIVTGIVKVNDTSAWSELEVVEDNSTLANVTVMVKEFLAKRG